MRIRLVAVSSAVLFGICAGPAVGHHAASEFDTTVVIEYEGVVSDFIWANPHIRIVLETESESGQPITLNLEGGSPSTLRLGGVAADTFEQGDRVTAFVSPSRRFPDSAGQGVQLIKEDGTIVPVITNVSRLGDAAAAAAEAARTPVTSGESASSIFGTWVARGGPPPLARASRQWQLTAAGQERMADYTPIMSPHAQCTPTSPPWLMVYSTASEFRDEGDRIVFRSDWMRAQRTIFMDGREHPPVATTFPLGHSVGRWEGSSLVIETTNFAEIIHNGIANSNQKRLAERFELSDDGTSMDYSFVMEDPAFLVGEVSWLNRFDYRPELTLENLECDREAAQRFFDEFR